MCRLVEREILRGCICVRARVYDKLQGHNPGTEIVTCVPFVGTWLVVGWVVNIRPIQTRFAVFMKLFLHFSAALLQNRTEPNSGSLLAAGFSSTYTPADV